MPDPHVRDGWLYRFGPGRSFWTVERDDPHPAERWSPMPEPCLVLSAPAIAQHAAGQAALALLTGDRRDEARVALIHAIHAETDAVMPYRAYSRILDALAALLPNGAPNA